MDVESAADQLYGLPPAEFTAARERLAARARAAGDRALAERIRALRRPTLAAWASNLLVRSRPGEARSLTALGDELRRARRGPGGTRPGGPDRRHHDLVASLTREAQRLAAESGREIGSAVREQVEATLWAALADPQAAERWMSGRLTRALDAPAAPGAPRAAGGGEPGPPSPPPSSSGGTGRPSGAARALRPAGGTDGGAAGPGAGRPLPGEPGPAVAARREAAAREIEVRHAQDALEGAEQRAHEADLQVAELLARLREARARKEAAHGAVRQAEERVREAERAARRAARHAREAGGPPERGARGEHP
ncbi:hypothetical protein LUX01_01020 [Streptomyces sudanensis]|uniref:hypothetical protein n=1 Tax=Streptomyces sudanensis TaxID=436397 RepID=UPI0020CCF9BF|nr:hypothetical protein [Streptomyces sudanensis]MCP9985493.1 hypothetical protein [Streptomyces sudanensis]